MTAQRPEKLKYKGKKYAMFSEPLEAYFASTGTRFRRSDISSALTRGNVGAKAAKPVYRVVKSSALTRGYVGTWKIKGGRLYLVKLKDGADKNARSCLAEYFPDHPDRVFAEWYSGKLRLPQGDLLKYVHGGYLSIYESDMFLTVEKGIVTGTEVRHNTAPSISEGAKQ